MSFRYSDHVKRRMRERKITQAIVTSVLGKPKHKFIDSETGYIVYTKELVFRGKKRPIAVSVDETTEIATIVTVHPIRERDIISRTENRRWI